MYIQLRLTIDPSGTRNYQAVWQMLNSFRKKWIFSQDPSAEYSCGFEVLNKYGESCDPHFHLNISFDPPLNNPLRSAKEWLRRYATTHDFTLKGNKVWSCTAVEEPEDYDRWIRYPLKEKSVTEFCSIDSGRMILMEIKAKEERKRSIELNIIKRDKAIEKQSFRDKLFEHLDGLHTAEWKDDPSVVPPPSHEIIWISILNYYREKGKAVCFKTINGYTILYQLHIGTIDPLQCYNMRLN